MRVLVAWFSFVFVAGFCLGTGRGEAPSKDGGATISGSVIYQPDAKRPWRYGRYYLKQGKDGPLSGALVCLSGKGLADKKGKPKKWQMDQKNFEYLPEVLAIMAGDQVEFINSDQALHNVAALGGENPFNIMTPIGKSLMRTFSSAGNEVSPVDISCGLHSQMHAWIYVFDHPYAMVTKADGKFELRNVPPGEYDLIVVHPSGKLKKKQKVVVKKGDKKVVEFVVSPDDLIGESK